jgi:hypothetical protein
MRAVNLLPRADVRSRRNLPSPWVALSAAAPLLAGSLVYLGYSVEHSSVLDKRAELGSVKAHIKAIRSSGSNAAGEAGLVSERSQRQAALADALAKGVAWDVTLDDLARVIPPDVWLTTMTAQSPTPAGAVATTGAAPNPTGFTLAGYAHSQEAVAHLLARLQLLPMLSDVTLGNTTSSSTTTGKGVLQFQLTAVMQPIPKAPMS